MDFRDLVWGPGFQHYLISYKGSFLCVQLRPLWCEGRVPLREGLNRDGKFSQGGPSCFHYIESLVNGTNKIHTGG